MENYNRQLKIDDVQIINQSLTNELMELNPNLGLARNKRKLFLLINIIDYVVENISTEIHLDEIAAETGASKFEICRMFSEYFDSSPMRWLWDVRIQSAKKYIEIAPHWSLTDISHACGFNSLAHFSRSFSKAHGVAPLKYKVHRGFPGKAAFILRKKYSVSRYPYPIRLMSFILLLIPSSVQVFR